MDEEKRADAPSCRKPRPSWPRSPSAQLGIALAALSPNRRRRARLERQGDAGPVQLPHEVWRKIAECLRLLEGGGAFDDSVAWATRGYLTPWSSEDDLVAAAWRITELLTASGVWGTGASGMYNIRALRRDAVKRRPLLEARAADLLNLRLASREWADAAKPAHDMIKYQHETIMRVFPVPIKRSRFRRFSGWPAIITLIVGFLAQGVVAVAVVDAMGGPVSASAYRMAIVANALVLAISALVGGLIAFFSADSHLNSFTGSAAVVVTCLGAVVASVAASARAFDLAVAPLTASAAAASPLLFASWGSTFISGACAGGTDDPDDVTIRVLAAIFLLPAWGSLIGASAAAARVSASYGALLALVQANSSGLYICTTRQAAAAGAAAAAASTLAAMAFAVALVSTLFNVEDDDDL